MILYLIKSFTTLSIVILGLTPAAAQETSGLVAKGLADDVWTEETEVNGSQVVSIRGVYKNDNAAGQPSAWIPAELAGQELCYSIIGDNGRYVGEQSLTVLPNWVGGMTTVPLKSKYDAPPRRVSDLKKTEAFGYLSTGACGTIVKDRKTLVSAWNTSAKEHPIGLRFYVNAAKNVEVEIGIGAGEVKACKDVLDDNYLYKTICEVELDASHIGQVLDVEILRFRPAINAAGDSFKEQLRSVFLDVQT